MSIALDIRLWFDDPRDVATRFDDLLACVAAWAPVEGPWRRATPGPKLSASSYVTHAATSTSVPLTVEAWGPEWIERGAAFGPRRVVGDASVWLHRCGPYRVGDHGSGHATVEEHLGDLMELLLALVDQVDPAALKVFTDVAPYLPVDAHAAYVRDADAVIDDLRLLATAWKQGLPDNEPLQATDPPRAFHEWRGREGSASLHAALARTIDRVDAVTPQVVEGVLRSGMFTTQPCGNGVLLLDYPHFVNGFLDPFYLAVLEAAS